MRKRKVILRHIIEFDVSEREVMDTDRTSFTIRAYVLRLNGKACDSYEVKNPGKGNPNDTARSYQHYILNYLEEDLKNFLRHHSMEAITYTDNTDDKDASELTKYMAHSITRLFPLLEKGRLRQRFRVKRALGGSKADWTQERKAEFLKLYERVLREVKTRSPELPQHVREQLSYPKVSAHEVARDYAAELFGVPKNTYLRRIITEARREKHE